MTPVLETAAQAAAISAAIIVVEELVRAGAARAAKKANAGPVVIRDIGEGMRAVAAVSIVSAVLGITGVASDFTILTFSGIMALAVSMALQTSLSNIIAGILLFSDGAVRLNDQVEYSSVKGSVVRLALRNTWIKAQDGTIVVVSNSSLSNGPLINHTATERLSKRYGIART